MDIIERAARALCLCNADTDGNWRAWVDDVRAVLGVFREPSEAMKYAGAVILADFSPVCGADMVEAHKIWQAMIDAALNPPAQKE